MTLRYSAWAAQAGDTYVDDVVFRDEDLRHIRIEGREFERVTLSRVSLNCSVFSEMHLQDVLIEECDLTRASFERCAFSRVTFRECRLDGVEFAATMTSDLLFERSSLKNSSFRFERLGALFNECNLQEADFTEADLSGSRMTGCELRAAQMFKANTQGLDLRTNNVSGIQSIDHLKGAIVDSYQLLDLATAMAKRIGIVVEEALPPD